MNLVQCSIVIPVYNAHRTLSRCVQSIVDQVTDYSFEIILIDDGSTDSSASLCDNLANTYPHIISFYRYENSGAFIARSRGILQAKGEYICFLDADDYWNQNAIQVISRIIENHSPDVILFGYDEVGVDESITSHVPPFTPGYYSSEKIELFRTELLGKDTLNTLWSKVIKKSLFLSVTDILNSFTGLSYGEDFLQIMYVFDFPCTFYVVNESLYTYVKNLTSTTASGISREAFVSLIFVYEQYLEFVYKWGFPIDLAKKRLTSLIRHGLYALLFNTNQKNFQKRKSFRSSMLPLLFSSKFRQFCGEADVSDMQLYYRIPIFLIRWNLRIIFKVYLAVFFVIRAIIHGVKT